MAIMLMLNWQFQILVLLLLSKSCIGGEICDDGWTLFVEGGKGVCLKVVKLSSTWDDAKVMCEALGATLGTINTPKLHYKVSEMTTLVTPVDGDIWLGGYEKNGVEGAWTWLDGTPWHWTRWGPDNPSDSGDGEDCLEFRSNHLWNDDSCGSPGKEHNAAGLLCSKRVCEHGWTLFQEGETSVCLKVLKMTSNWHTAKIKCEDLGATLGAVNSPTLHDEVFALKNQVTRDNIWLGGYKKNGVDGAWTWLDGTSWEWTRWSLSNPSNADVDKDCAALAFDYIWTGESCSKQYPGFLCSKNVGMKYIKCQKEDQGLPKPKRDQVHGSYRPQRLRGLSAQKEEKGNYGSRWMYGKQRLTGPQGLKRDHDTTGPKGPTRTALSSGSYGSKAVQGQDYDIDSRIRIGRPLRRLLKGEDKHIGTPGTSLDIGQHG